MKTATQLAKEYEWRKPSQYFDYIIGSVINGQRLQAAMLFVKMDQQSCIQFWEYLRSIQSQDVINKVIDHITSRI